MILVKLAVELSHRTVIALVLLLTGKALFVSPLVSSIDFVVKCIVLFMVTSMLCPPPIVLMGESDCRRCERQRGNGNDQSFEHHYLLGSLWQKWTNGDEWSLNVAVMQHAPTELHGCRLAVRADPLAARAQRMGFQSLGVAVARFAIQSLAGD
jgi:hypothetical protein